MLESLCNQPFPCSPNLPATPNSPAGRYGVYGQEHKHRGYGAYGQGECIVSLLPLPAINQCLEQTSLQQA